MEQSVGKDHCTVWSVRRRSVGRMAGKANLQVTVEPAKVGFKAPNDGTQAGIVRIKINNNMKERLVFKIKLTNPDRFAVGPPYGFVEPVSSFFVKIKPKPFDASKLPANDHFSVLIAKAPAKVTDAGQVWKKGGPHEPKESKRFVVNTLYCKGNTPLPPVIADPRAAKPGAPPAAKPAAPAAAKKPAEASSSEASESEGGDEDESEVSEELSEEDEE